MKTSIIEVRDMLSILTVDEVETRIGEVPGVESATVNYAAHKHAVEPTPEAAPASASPPEPAVPKAAPVAPASAPKPAAPAGDGQQDEEVPAATPSTPVAAKEE